jgi:hypothetical protein
MTMYLSNQDVRPTGYEAGEFIEPVADVPVTEPSLPAGEVDTDANGPSVR